MSSLRELERKVFFSQQKPGLLAQEIANLQKSE